MHPKCKAACCGIVPIPKHIYEANWKEKITEPDEILETEDAYIPITKTGKCVFLKKDLSCNIYENRPDICKKFGDESHPMLCCPVADKNGKERSRQDKRRIERKANKCFSSFYSSFQ